MEEQLKERQRANLYVVESGRYILGIDTEYLSATIGRTGQALVHIDDETLDDLCALLTSEQAIRDAMREAACTPVDAMAS